MASKSEEKLIRNVKPKESDDTGIIIHPFEPFYDHDSTILILGSFPSVKSREENFYYAHPSNRFWEVCATVFDRNTPHTIEEKKEFLITSGLALYDTIYSCSISGSSDSSIKNVTPADINIILKNSDIRKIFCNGRTAHNLYNRYIRKSVQEDAIYLPSTSAANASFSLDMLIAEWKIISLFRNL
jgi:hypoxanthine-DNA glycosylase